MQFISETLDQWPDLDWLTFLSFNWIRRGRKYFDNARNKTANKCSNNGNKAESYCPTSRQLWMQPSIQWLQEVFLGLQYKAFMAAVEAIVISSKSDIFERSKESLHSDSLFESLKNLWRNGLPALGISLTQAKLLIEYRRSHELFGPLRVNIS